MNSSIPEEYYFEKMIASPSYQSASSSIVTTMVETIGLRFLGVGGEKVVIDYTVFGMVIFTMILLLIVGVMRHKVDHWAKRNDYFETVLEACYHELSTLGIVEAVIFILHKYYKDLNIQVERVFAEVHFTLFFVVIINAIMSVLLYFLASRVANNQWVRMEAIDLDHYVAVRKQYDDVNRKLATLEVNNNQFSLNDQLKRSIGRSTSRDCKKDGYQRSVSFEIQEGDVVSNSARRRNENEFRPSTRIVEETSPEEMNDMNKDEDEKKNWFIRFWNYNFKRKLLKRKQHELLVQVRFHELRVHFIESHQLPPNFRVSEYLKLCMIDEFKNLVHVSSLSWGILILITNLIYFTMGIIFFRTEDDERIGIALTSFYLGYAIIFVILSSIVFIKMKQVFFKIVKDDSWIEAITERDHELTTSKGSERDLNLSTRTVEYKDFNQNEYFWGSNPSLVVTMAQLMQFGYAISFAVLLVFNNALGLTKSRNFWFFWYPTIPVVCYCLYLSLWCNIMPKYTQCTSLGQLVRNKHLVEIDAISKLSKAKTRRQEEIDYLQAEKEVAANMKARSKPPKKPRQRQRQDSLQSALLRKFMGIRSEDENKDLDDSRNDGSLNHSDRLRRLSSLVKKETENLPNETLVKRRKDRQRARSVSDGVAAMRLFSTTSALAQEALSTSALVEKGDPEVESMKGNLESFPTRPKGRRRKMVSTGVFFMQSEKPPPFPDFTDGTKTESLSIHPRNTLDDLSNSRKLDHMMLRNSAPLLEGRSKFENDHIKDSRSTTDTKMKRNLSPLHENHSAKVNHAAQEIQKVETSTKLEIFDDDLSMDSEEKELDDDLSIDSGESVGIRENLRPMEEETNISFCDRIQLNFLHSKYSIYSALFGTMPIFFFLSFRIETLLLDTCIMKDNQNTWNFLPSRGTTFWFTVVWFLALLAESSIICFLYCRKNSKLKVDMFAPAVFDIFLTAICFGLFLWAEVERCCECDQPSVTYKAAPSNYGGCVYDEYSTCCPSFGTRLCGGIGTVEPFVSLIALRLFRVYISRLCMSCFRRLHVLISKDQTSREEVVIPDDKKSGVKESESYEVVDESISGKQGKIEHQTGTIAELWILGLEKYPEIVEEHGPFSGLLLEAMLGIDALPKDANIHKDLHEKSAEKDKIPFSDLPIKNEQDMKGTLRRGISTMSLYSGGGNSITDFNIHDNNFDRPSAPLIRSMRRCECKWEWLKSAGSVQWDIVDIILTECEIVWFNASADPTYWDDSERKRVEKIKRAIITKKGGKGLRLSDVAAGREVLGRMALADIDHIKINRHAPCALSIKSNEGNVGLDLEESRKVISKEFWMESNKINLPLEKQWEQVTEDRLKLHSNQGTLSLRFFVDLYEVVEPSMGKDEIERKKGALLWCESISHLCKKSQLKQKLPHFGEDRDHELKDFIEIVPRLKEDSEKYFWKLNLPRAKSERRLAQNLFADPGN